jgi:hypothetical protein
MDLQSILLLQKPILSQFGGFVGKKRDVIHGVKDFPLAAG